MLNPEIEERYRSLIRAEFWVNESRHSLPTFRGFTSGERTGFAELLHLLGYEAEEANVYRDETMKLRSGHYPSPTRRDYRKLRKIERTKLRIVMPGSRINGPH